MKKRQIFNLRGDYEKSFLYLKESKNFIWIAAGIFILFSLIGFFIYPPEEISEEIYKFMAELVKKTENMSQTKLILFIFFNNLKSSFIGMVSGIIFGIIPTIIALANGYLVGFVSNIAVNAEGISSLWRIFPHGIFELPAVFISLGLGIKIGISALNERKFGSFKGNLISSLRVFLLIVIPLLIIAAIIEGMLIFSGV